MKHVKKIRFNSQVSEVQLIYKSKIDPLDRPKVTTYREAIAIFREHWNADTIELQEEVKVLYLNRGLRVLGLYPLSTGGMTDTTVDCRLIVLAGIRLGATALMLCHNHPSGSTIPSEPDKTITQKVKAAAGLLDIRVVDHIILTKTGHFSFASDGLL